MLAKWAPTQLPAPLAVFAPPQMPPVVPLKPRASKSKLKPKLDTTPLVDASPTAPLAAPSEPAPIEPHYFELAEVDEPALPKTDWQLDTDFAFSLGIRKLSFEVRVNELGAPVSCHLLDMEPFVSVVIDVLAEQICLTPMQPAQRAGVAVPSVKVVELVLAS
jgi:hypothetical protein